MREMKDSGIEWMGSIPILWETQRVKHGFYRKKIEAHQDNPVVLSLARSGVRVRDISNNEGQIAESYYNYNPVDIDDLLINPMDLYSGANCSISKVEGVISQAYINLRFRDGYNPEYYDYYFKLQYWMMAFFAYGKGVSFENRWTLNADTLMNYPIIKPSYEEQYRIADYLDKKCAKIDAIIEKQQEIIEKLKEYKLSVITEAVTKGLNPDAEMKDSGIEWIEKMPKHWDKIKLKNCSYIRARLGWKGLKADEYVEEGYPLLSAFNIVNNKIDFTNNVNYISKFRYDESPEIKLNEGDILLVKDGAGIGKCGIIEYLPIPSTTNGSLAVITTDNSIVPKFLYYYFLSSIFQNYINRLKDGMGVPHLFQSDLREIEIVVPTVNEQKKIVEHLESVVENIDKKIYLIEKIITKSIEYKKSLIYEVVTGKKEV